MKDLKTFLGQGFKLGARSLLAATLAVAALGLAAAPASAATIVVNTTIDQSLGSCSSSCSLRDAVATAASGDTVQIPAGHYVLTLGQISPSPGGLTLAGAGARTTVIDGNAASGIFKLTMVGFTVSDVSLINGNNPSGGAISATNANLHLFNCTVANNQADNGGGVNVDSGSFFIVGCTFSNNSATFEGGGLFVSNSSEPSLINNTFSGNVASEAAAIGLSSSSTVFLINNTITANRSNSAGGGALSTISSIDPFGLTNNIISGNTGGDCHFTQPQQLAIDTNNLDSDNSCGFTGPGDLPGTNPLLGPLANNGGPTDTYALLAGSPAVNAGDNTFCPATDQRGVSRPQGPACDIGAFERVPTPQDQIAALIAQVKALVAAGKLTQSNANPLLNTLENAAKHLDKGQVTQTCKELGDFIQKVNGDIHTGKLTAADGQALIDAANAIRVNLGC